MDIYSINFKDNVPYCNKLIDHCTVGCLVAWPLNESEAGVDLALVEIPSN